MGDDGGSVLRIAHQAGHVGHEHKPFGVERDGAHRSGDVGIAVVDFSVFAPRGRADDRREATPHGFLQRRDVDLDDFADVADVNFFAGIVLVVEQQLTAFENIRAIESARLAAERFDGLDDLRVDLA